MFNFHRIGLEHQYGRRDVSWKSSIFHLVYLSKLHRAEAGLVIYLFIYFVKTQTVFTRTLVIHQI